MGAAPQMCHRRGQGPVAYTAAYHGYRRKGTPFFKSLGCKQLACVALHLNEIHIQALRLVRRVVNHSMDITYGHTRKGTKT